MKKNIPVIRAKLNSIKDGIKILSMVNEPAIMINYVQMETDKQNVKMAIIDEGEGIVIAPALVPDLPIYRNINGKEFYLVFDKEVILDTLIKLSKDKTDANIDTNHDGNLVSDVIVFEKFVTDERRVTSVAGFEDKPMGTLFFSAKINNPTQLAKVKSGEINGWSIDGMFDFELKEMLEEKEILAMIEEILN